MSDPHLNEEARVALAWGEPATPGVTHHLGECAACAAAVAAMRAIVTESHALLQPLEAADPLDAATAERILAPLRASLAAPTEARWRRWAPTAAVVLFTTAIFTRYVLRGHAVALPLAMWVAAIVAGLLAATEYAARVAGLTVALAVVLALFGDVPAGPMVLRDGLPCLRLELVVGLAAGAVSVWARRDRRDVAELAAKCGAAALAAQAGVTLSCHGSGGHAHTLLFHAMGVALAVACSVPVARWRASAAA